VVERRDEGFKVQGVATILGRAGEPSRLLAEAVLMFVNLGGNQSGAELADNFVFTPEFLGMFRGVDLPEADERDPVDPASDGEARE
jgi:hypothetical protein